MALGLSCFSESVIFFGCEHGTRLTVSNRVKLTEKYGRLEVHGTEGVVIEVLKALVSYACQTQLEWIEIEKGAERRGC
jgi:hypothetical protein